MKNTLKFNISDYVYDKYNNRLRIVSISANNDLGVIKTKYKCDNGKWKRKFNQQLFQTDDF